MCGCECVRVCVYVSVALGKSSMCSSTMPWVAGGVEGGTARLLLRDLQSNRAPGTLTSAPGVKEKGIKPLTGTYYVSGTMPGALSNLLNARHSPLRSSSLFRDEEIETKTG